jgi:prepilin-type N-terminal cleavage/methylation domain-containing protein
MNLRQLVKNSALRRRGGFTLLEGLIGVSVMGILITALYTGMTSGFGVVRFARENLRATQVLQEKFESMRLYTWDQINNTNFVPSSFSAPIYGNANSTAVYNGTVTIARSGLAEAYADDLRKVTVELNWTSGNIPRKRTLTSYVARYGLQNYIY